MEVPRHWTNAIVRIKRRNIKDILESDRVKCIGIVKIENRTNTAINSLFSFVVNNREIGLRKLDIKYTDMSTLPPENLSAAVRRIEDVELGWTDLTTNQLTTLSLDMYQGSGLKMIH